MTLRITLKGGPGSGWHAPSRGTHTGEKHRAVGSGKSVKPKTSDAAGVDAMRAMLNPDLQQYAEEYVSRQMSEQSINEAVDNLATYVREYPIAINTSRLVAIDVLFDGEFKNQHDAAVSASGGLFDPSYRDEMERQAFNIASNSAADHPIYGYVSDGAVVLGSRRGTEYGNVEFVLKDSVRNRATVTAGDSLGLFSSRTGAPSPLLAPSKASLGLAADKLLAKKYTFDYAEAQVHGGVSVSDIAKVIIHPWKSLYDKPKYSKLQDDRIAGQARLLGIPVEVISE